MSRRARRIGFLAAAASAALLLAAAAPAAASSPCGAFVDVDACVDDFSCYKARPSAGASFARLSVTLEDQFEVVTATVVKPTELCLPADKEQEGTLDPATHLVRYLIKRQSPRHIQRTALKITNQLGEIRVNTVKPKLLLVPSAKGLTTPPGQPSATTHVDHYKCYRVRVTQGSPAFASGTVVRVADQFEAERRMSLVKPRHLCTPVDKNGEGVANPNLHLLCYLAKPAVGEPRHTRRAGVYVENQLGLLQLDTLKDREVCIPSTKSFSPSGAFLENELE